MTEMGCARPPRLYRARSCQIQKWKELPHQLTHLEPNKQSDNIAFLQSPCLFGDVPTRTNVLTHDIDVNVPHPLGNIPAALTT